MRSLVNKLRLSNKKDSPPQSPPVIYESALPRQTGQTNATNINQKQGPEFEYHNQTKTAYFQNHQSMSQSLSQTQKVSKENGMANDYVEITSIWDYKTPVSNQFDASEPPYGPTKCPTFGPQWGMTTSEGVENAESPYRGIKDASFGSQYGTSVPKDTEPSNTTYGKADVYLYGPQYGIPQLSREDDLYNDSDDERRNHESLQNITKVQELNFLAEVKTEEATIGPHLDDAIPLSWTWEYDPVTRKHSILYNVIAKESKPKSTEAAIPPAVSCLSPLGGSQWHIDEDFVKSPPLSSISDFHQNTNGNSSKLAEKIKRQSMDTFIDSELERSRDLCGYSEDDIDIVLTPKSGPTSCIICTDDFSATLRPPGWITVSCTHEPSVCCGCMARCIKTDLESKIWNQITCPECKTLLVYEDIQRLADPETFAKYEALSFRNAIGKDENFVWCQNCDFGQFHTGGNEQPIVRCMKCGFRSCFRHTVPWHDCLTCLEYDEMLKDPDGFKSAIERDEEAAAFALKQQHEADEKLARELEVQDRQAEENRRRAAHEEELRIARKAQEAEAERKRLENEKKRAKKREEIKLRKQQEELSLQTVKSTTKNCPGCQWPIEKNHGCSHMTCIKCRTEFCWSCLNDYKAIRKLGNSEHKPTCKFHSDNLPCLGPDSDSDSDSD